MEKCSILIAEQKGPWRDAFLEVLEQEGYAVQTTEDGEDVRKLFVDPLAKGTSPFHAVVLGRVLKNTGAHDLVHMVSEIRAKNANAAGLPGWVLLVTDVRQDFELIGLFRKRGVREFLYPDEELIRTLARVNEVLFAARRAAPRYRVSLEAVLVVGGQVAGSIEDISESGVLFVVPANKCKQPIAIGMQFEMTFEDRTDTTRRQIRAKVELRSVMTKKKIFSTDSLCLGLRFLSLDNESRTNLASLLDTYAAIAAAAGAGLTL